MIVLDPSQLCNHSLKGLLSGERAHQVIERITIEADRLGVVNGRHLEPAELRAQCPDGASHIVLPIDISADADEDARQLGPNSALDQHTDISRTPHRTRLIDTYAAPGDIELV